MTTFQRCARYSPDKKLFICETPEDVAELEGRGWTVSPAYPPDQAMWVREMPAAEPPPPPPKTTKKPK